MLEENDHQVCFLEIEAEGGGPILYVNSGVEDLQMVLDSNATSGARAAARNAVFDSIAQPVWLALVVSAANLYSDYEAEADAEPYEPEGPGWAQSVLEAIAEQVFPDDTTEQGVKRLARALTQREELVDVMQRVTLAVQKHLVLQKSTVALLRTVEGQG